MSNRDDFENVAREIASVHLERIETELHNAFVAGQEHEVRTMASRLRALAHRLETRACAPSLEGYGLVDGIRAATDLLEELPGPAVHADETARGYVSLATLLPGTGEGSE